MYETLRKKIKAKKISKNVFTFLISDFFFSEFTFYKEALCFITFVLSLGSNTLTLESIFKYIHHISSRDEVVTRLFFFFSSRDENSSLQKRVNSKRFFTVDRDDFVPGRVSFRDEISPVNTLLGSSFQFNLLPLRVRLHVTEMKSQPGMKLVPG